MYFCEILQALRRWPCNRPIFDVPEPRISFRVYLKCAVDIRNASIQNICCEWQIHEMYLIICFILATCNVIYHHTKYYWRYIQPRTYITNTYWPTIVDDCPILIISVKLDLLKKRKNDVKHLILTLNLLITVLQALIGAKSKYHNSRSVKIFF